MNRSPISDRINKEIEQLRKDRYFLLFELNKIELEVRIGCCEIFTIWRGSSLKSQFLLRARGCINLTKREGGVKNVQKSLT